MNNSYKNQIQYIITFAFDLFLENVDKVLSHYRTRAKYIY